MPLLLPQEEIGTCPCGKPKVLREVEGVGRTGMQTIGTKQTAPHIELQALRVDGERLCRTHLDTALTAVGASGSVYAWTTAEMSWQDGHLGWKV
jgi:hypothetical protein